jgi:hypothetical protein
MKKLILITIMLALPAAAWEDNRLPWGAMTPLQGFCSSRYELSVVVTSSSGKQSFSYHLCSSHVWSISRCSVELGPAKEYFEGVFRGSEAVASCHDHGDPWIEYGGGW